jgi:hypothetical protein
VWCTDLFLSFSTAAPPFRIKVRLPDESPFEQKLAGLNLSPVFDKRCVLNPAMKLAIYNYQYFLFFFSFSQQERCSGMMKVWVKKSKGGRGYR